MRRVFTPIIKADYEALETYQYDKTDGGVLCDISVFYGSEDDLTSGGLTRWKLFTGGMCNFLEFPGGHFFIRTRKKDVASTINSIINSKINIAAR